MLELLKFLLSKDNYVKYRGFVPKGTNPTVDLLYDYLDQLFGSLERDLTFDEYSAFVLGQLPNITKKDRDTYELIQTLIDKAGGSNIAADAAELLLNNLRERSNSFKLAEAYLNFSEGRITSDELHSTIDSCTIVRTSVERTRMVQEDLEALVTQEVLTPGLRWRLKTLNQSLGSLRMGDFGFIFARPEVGKTTWLCSEGSFMLKQLVEANKPLLYINNEEESRKVKVRFIQSWFGVTRQQLIANLREYSERFREETKGLFCINEGSLKDRREIESIIEYYQPGLIICDALDAIEGFKADREDLRLGTIFKWAQDLSKQYCPFIGTTWADGSAEGIKWLNMGHVTNAKTEKQKPAQFILGIGSTGDDYMRHIAISKNKLIGDPDTEEGLRHDRFDVLIRPETARFEDIG